MSNPLFTPEELNDALNSMILSASGWRKIFNYEKNEESLSPQIEPIDRYLTALSAYSFATHLLQHLTKKTEATLLIGQDSRPTGRLLRSIVNQIFYHHGMTVCDAAIIAIPELLAKTRHDDTIDGFFYLSASHNPPGYNGFKFGFTDGSVVGGDESNQIIALFLSFISHPPIDFLRYYHQCRFDAILDDSSIIKHQCLRHYHYFLNSIAANSNNIDQINSYERTITDAIKANPLSIVIDFNGSSRLTSCDVDYLSAKGIIIDSSLSSSVGYFTHAIIPEGASLEPLRRKLEELARHDASFKLGYMPDCDGDRGNIVIFNRHTQKAQIIDAQSLFALCVVSELAYLAYLNYDMSKVAIVCNDATSLRVKVITDSFGAHLFICETGEANVVARAEEARMAGYTVRLLGEGSNGGNITYPSSVRDPLNSINSIINLLYLSSKGLKKGLMAIWLEKRDILYDPAFDLSDLLTSLPTYCTTSAFEADALMKIIKNPRDIKMAFDQLFPIYWPSIKLLLLPLAVDDYQEINYEGTTIHIGFGNRHGQESGGLKILFMSQHKEVAFIWFRGSKTEPVMRLMADISVNCPSLERELKKCLKAILEHADRL